MSLVSPCNSGAVSVRRPSVRQFAAAVAAAAVGADQLLAQRETKNSKPLPPVRPTSCYRRGIEAVSRPVRGCVEDTEVVLQLISRSSSSTHQLISLPLFQAHTHAQCRRPRMVFPRHFALNCWTEGGEGEARAAAAGALRAGAGAGVVVVVACRAAEGTTDERGGTIHDRACGVSE